MLQILYFLYSNRFNVKIWQNLYFHEKKDMKKCSTEIWLYNTHRNVSHAWYYHSQRFTFLAVWSHPWAAASHHTPKMPRVKRNVLLLAGCPGWPAGVLGVIFRESWTFVLSLLLSLTAGGDLGDTKQETLNKWKLWMFISRHSSSSQKTRQSSPNQASDTRLSQLTDMCSHKGDVKNLLWIRPAFNTRELAPLILSQRNSDQPFERWHEKKSLLIWLREFWLI